MTSAYWNERREKEAKEREDKDGDKLMCSCCNRFVDEVNEDGVCQQCEEG